MKKKPASRKTRAKKSKPAPAVPLDDLIRADELGRATACSKKEDCLCLVCKAERRDAWLAGEEARVRVAKSPRWDFMDYVGIAILAVAIVVLGWFGWTYWQLGHARQEELRGLAFVVAS